MKKNKLNQTTLSSKTVKFTAISQLLLFLAILSYPIPELNAQKKLDFGVRNTLLGRDFGVEGSLGYTFKNQHVQVRLDGGRNWVSYQEKTESLASAETWAAYSNVRLSLIGSGNLGEHIRIYGGGGPIFGFIDQISTSSIGIGGFGYYGFGFLGPRSETFLELGGVGSLGKADRLDGAPLIATGFYLSVGYRFIFSL